MLYKWVKQRRKQMNQESQSRQTGDKLLVNRKIELKAIMTDLFKEESDKEFEQQLKQIDRNMAQLQDLIKTKIPNGEDKKTC